MKKMYIIAAAWLSLLLLAACSDGVSNGSGGNSADSSLAAAPAAGNRAIMNQIVQAGLKAVIRCIPDLCTRS